VARPDQARRLSIEPISVVRNLKNTRFLRRHRRVGNAATAPSSRRKIFDRGVVRGGAPVAMNLCTTIERATDAHFASELRFPEGPIAMADGSVLRVEIERGTLTRVDPRGGARGCRGDRGCTEWSRHRFGRPNLHLGPRETVAGDVRRNPRRRKRRRRRRSVRQSGRSASATFASLRSTPAQSLKSIRMESS
jgi:hypothetical protein